MIDQEENILLVIRPKYFKIEPNFVFFRKKKSDKALYVKFMVKKRAKTANKSQLFVSILTLKENADIEYI